MASPALLAALSLAAALAAGETALPVESMALEIRNAQVEDLSGDRLIEVVVRARAQVGEPTWVAYEIPGVARRGSLCCGPGPCCDVEEPQVQTGTHDHPSLGAVAVLVRFAGGVAQRIRTVSLDCPVSFAGRRVLWAGVVDADESLDVLGEWMGADERRLAEAATAAVALHAAPRAAAMLTAVARHDASPQRRRSALFWLGQRDTEGVGETIYQAAMTDHSSEVARHAVFVLGQLSEPRGLSYLVRVLDQHTRPELRREALFWIGQSSEPDALETVSRILNQ